MGEPDAESGPYNLCKYKHFAPHAHAILRFFRAHKPTMALLSPAEPLSHSALCFYRGKIPWRFVSMPSIVLSVGATFCLLPQIVCWLRMTARLLRPISLPLRATVFCLRIAGEKRGILAEKWGRKREKLPLFRCLLPCFSHRDASPALSAGVFLPRASDRRNRCRGRTLQPAAHRAAAGTVCVGHATNAHRSRTHRPAAAAKGNKNAPGLRK